MRCKYPHFFVLLVLALLCPHDVHAAEGVGNGLVIRPTVINIHESAGKLVREKIVITNYFNESVDVQIKELTGGVGEVVTSLAKARVTIARGETKDLGFQGYISRGTGEGLYGGYLVLIADDVEYKIPVNLTVSKSARNISGSLDIKPIQSEIQPGQTLGVVSDIRWSGERMDFIYRLQLVDPDTGAEILVKNEDITIQDMGSVRIDLEIPKNIESKEYLLRGTVYSPILAENITSSTESIRVKSGFIPRIDMPKLDSDQLMLVSIGALILSVLLIIYIHHKREVAKRKRYLESIDFTTLPGKSSNTAFVGRIAETSATAFMELNQLQMHALIAGATGSGKTIAAQVLAEEALRHKRSVIVFDPTAQWTGFLRKNNEVGMFRLYKHFRMRERDANAFDGNIYTVKDPNEKIDVGRYIRPGEISVFCLNKLDPSMIDSFIENTIKEVFEANLEESPELKVLFVYDEVHRLLPKFGGSGRGFLQIDRAVREFRKWGVGLVLISQVLSDFIGEIKANIGTEIQMRTRYENDLDRIKLKYGEDIFKSVIKASVGTGMVQNAEYNKGRPYFISFRPLLHNPRKLPGHELELYDKFNVRFSATYEKIELLKKSDIDTFDIDLELDLAQDNLKKGSFTVVDLYLGSLEPKIDKLVERLKSGEIREGEKAIRSEWEIKREAEIKAYDEELGAIIEGQKGSIDHREKVLSETEQMERGKLELEKKKLLEEEAEVKKELEFLEEKLENKVRVLEILKRLQERKEILNRDVMQKEMKKLEKEELELAKEKEDGKFMIKRRELLDKEKKTLSGIEAEKKYLEDETKRLKRRLDEIQQDKEMILEKDRQITISEEELKGELMDKIRAGFEEKRMMGDMISKEKGEEELQIAMRDVEKKLQENRTAIVERGRGERNELKGERDRLHDQLREMKEKWKGLLEREREMVERERELKGSVMEQETLIVGEKTKMEELGKEWETVSFEEMEKEWDRMDRLKEEKDRLNRELEAIRENLRGFREVKARREERIEEKEGELEGFEKEGDNST